jgi:hypothetical protein
LGNRQFRHGHHAGDDREQRETIATFGRLIKNFDIITSHRPRRSPEYLCKETTVANRNAHQLEGSWRGTPSPADPLSGLPFFVRLEERVLGYVIKSRIKADLIPAIDTAVTDERFVLPSLSMSEDTP